MDKYAIYKYELSKQDSIQGDLTMGDEVTAPKMEHAYENFGNVFGTKPSEFIIKEEKKNGEGELYPCHMLVHHNNIIVLRIENNKNKELFELRQSAGIIPIVEKKQYTSNPPLYIIIDNRPGVALMAIEIDTTAWAKTNVVRDLLQKNLNRMLEPFGLTIKIWSKMQRSDYWSYVKLRQKEGHGIKRMSFQFPNTKINPSDLEAIKMSQHVKSLIAMIDSLGAGQGELLLQPPANQSLAKKKLRDITNMVALCSASERYSLSVTFDDDITYRCNDYIRAELPMKNPKILDDFINGQTTTLLDFGIESWLNEVIEKTEKYQDAEQVKPKSNRKSRKKVS